MDYAIIIFLLIIVAVGPWLIFFICYSRLKTEFVKIFIMGGVGWYAALMLRLPILIPASIYLDPLASGLVGALCAGLFEEYVRFFFARQFIKNKITNGKVASLGIGWGLSEAFLVYALSMVILWIIIAYNIDIPNFTVPSTEELFVSGLIGAIERNIATMLHTILTMFIVRSFENRKLLYSAIIYHILVDIFAMFYHVYRLNIILVEMIFFCLTIIGLILTKMYIKGDIWNFFMNPKNEF